MMTLLGRWLTHWSEPLFPVPAATRMPLGALALLLRLFAAGLIGIVLTLLGLRGMGFLTNAGFINYGYDKLFGGNQVYGMDADFFRALNIPLPEVNQVMIGALELFGGLALLAGFLTRLFAMMLAGNMLVAMLTMGNVSAEGPLFVACALLVVLGGGLLSVDQLMDRAVAQRRALRLAGDPRRPPAGYAYEAAGSTPSAGTTGIAEVFKFDAGSRGGSKLAEIKGGAIYGWQPADGRHAFTAKVGEIRGNSVYATEGDANGGGRKLAEIRDDSIYGWESSPTGGGYTKKLAEIRDNIAYGRDPARADATFDRQIAWAKGTTDPVLIGGAAAALFYH
ncbi:MAG TPA: DoxX family protein [Chloroflexia bacterium]|nr:DoxX family protein [Chloroflexia bacterium]